MIGRIEGVLESIQETTALVRLGSVETGSLTYLVLLPAFTAFRLQGQMGQRVSLLTFHFVESQNQGTTLLPRLAGFLSEADRDFFELFTTCKGVGNKRGLRAMSMEPYRIAIAIAGRDIATLQTLPEIGKRMAETIIATLHGKVDRFLIPPASAGSTSADTPEQPNATSVKKKGRTSKQALNQTIQGEQENEDGHEQDSLAQSPGMIAHQALEVLVQLGESRADAGQWIDQVLRQPQQQAWTVQSFITQVYRVKSGR